MKSNLVSASVLAISALAFFGSASSFAQSSNLPGDNNYLRIDSAPAASGKTRADVRAELLQSPPTANTGDNNYLRIDGAPAASGKTRADVRAELEQAQRDGYKLSVDHS